MSEYTLRPYQKECIEALPESGSVLVRMATGMGKTVMFSQIPRKGRMLILSHRKELVEQPAKYFDCSFGIEQGDRHSNGEEVISASVQSMVRRLDQFQPDDFDIIITDEAHHAAAASYRKIYDYFTPRLHVGVTATPTRGDHVRLDDIYEKIVFDRDLKWGIEQGYLSDIDCYRAKMSCDLRNIKTSMGDFQVNELENALSDEAVVEEIADVYEKMAVGKTLIFTVSVKTAELIAAAIPGAVSVSAQSKDRETIVERFKRDPNCNCMVNCMIFTEGTDIPNVETIIVARPTQSETLYTQMVGRGTRLFPGKDKLKLIDMIGISGDLSLCTAPTLMGINIDDIQEEDRDILQGDLLELPEKAEKVYDTPAKWMCNFEFVDIWAKKERVDLHNINFFKMPDGSLILSLKDEKWRINAPDECGQVICGKKRVPLQQAIDSMYCYLLNEQNNDRNIWDRKIINKWSNTEASEKQLYWIEKKLPDFDTEGLTKGQASQILNRIFSSKNRKIKDWNQPDYKKDFDQKEKRKQEYRQLEAEGIQKPKSKKTKSKGKKGDFYVVFEGYEPGVYNTWYECQAQTNGYSGASFMKFKTKDQAYKAYTAYKKQQKYQTQRFGWK